MASEAPMASEMPGSPEKPTFSEMLMDLKLPIISNCSYWQSPHWHFAWSFWAWRPPSLDRACRSPIKSRGLVKGLSGCWDNKSPKWQLVKSSSGGSSRAFSFCYGSKEWLRRIIHRRKTRKISHRPAGILPTVTYMVSNDLLSPPNFTHNHFSSSFDIVL